MIIRRTTWAVFVGVLVLIAYVSLKACELNLPLIGGLISHCPNQPVIKPYISELAETQQLTRTLQDLRVQLSSIEQCEIEQPEVEKLTEPPEELIDKDGVEVNKAAQILIILDDSISMLEATDAQKYPDWQNTYDRYYHLLDKPQRSFSEQQELESLLYKMQEFTDTNKSRLHAAKQAIIPVLNDDHEAPTSLWSFNDCQKLPKQHFPIGGISATNAVKNLPAIGATPIAGSIEYIPNMLTIEGAGMSRDKSVNVVLFTDGNEGCYSAKQINEGMINKDPCAAARQLKKEYPFVFIHSVSLADNVDAVRCVADETGGIVAKAGDQEGLSNMLEYIAKESK